jgi:outer membrane protein OmpA-like peptidoglycan-associated protein
MRAPSTPRPRPWPAGRAGRGLRHGVLLVALLTAVLAFVPSAVAAEQPTATTLAGESTSIADPNPTTDSTRAATADGTGSPAGVGIDVIPRVVDLVIRTSNTSGGKDAATISEQPGSTKVDLAADVLFAFDSDKLTPAAQAQLAATTKLIRDRAKGPVRVEGHTDAIGSQSYNLALSQRRARVVRDALAKLLTDRPTQFTVKGFGANKPVAANTNPDGSDNPNGRAKNRRVVVAFSTQG